MHPEAARKQVCALVKAALRFGFLPFPDPLPPEEIERCVS
jgi:hypothetical protein